MGDDEGEESGFFIKDEQKWLEAEKYRADVERYKTEQYVTIINKGIESFQLYMTAGRRLMTIAVFILIAAIFFSMAFLTYFDKISGETFAFVAGTIVGYIISILKQ